MRIPNAISILSALVLAVASPARASSGRILSTSLPNLHQDAAGEVTTGAEVPVSLDLEKEWDINARAPSWLALFRMKGKKAELVREFARRDLQGRKVKLPPMISGKYRLQGTFYFCKEGAAAVCVIQSHDRELTARAAGPTSLEITLRQP